MLSQTVVSAGLPRPDCPSPDRASLPIAQAGLETYQDPLERETCCVAPDGGSATVEKTTIIGISASTRRILQMAASYLLPCGSVPISVVPLHSVALSSKL